MLAIEKASINKQLIGGAKWSVTEILNDYPASNYKLKYVFRKSGELPSEYFTTASGDSHLLEIPAEETSKFASSYYNITVYAVSRNNPEEIFPVGATVVYIVGDINTASDARGFYLTMVEKLETAMISLADKTMSSVSIEGQSYNYNDIERLEKLAEYYRFKAGIKSEHSDKRRILARFTNE